MNPSILIKTVLVTLAMVAVMAFALPAANAQNFGGAFEGMRNTDDPIQIEADRLEVEDSKGLAVFNGNVSVVQGTTILKSGNLKVFYFANRSGGGGPNGDIKKIEAGGRVAVRSGDQKATATSMVFDMATQIVTLSGNVEISQGPNIVTGCTLRVDMKTNAAKLTPCKSSSTQKTGRVQMLLTPSSRNN